MPTDEERWDEAEREARAEARAGSFKPLAALMPTPGPMVESVCRVCQGTFQTESVVFRGNETEREHTLFPTVCDACADTETAKAPKPASDPQEVRRREWVRMVGSRYATFSRPMLPAAILPLVERVLDWSPKSIIGIGLLGPPRTGKSPLLFALGQSLYVSGVDVWPTSGIEFQREYMRGIEDRERWGRYLDACEQSAVLLIDDADKLNLSPGVEAEYYGMLETRRNWQRPVLCTLNLTGDEFKALGRDRSDRANAIVERLRDLCEFIPVNT